MSRFNFFLCFLLTYLISAEPVPRVYKIEAIRLSTEGNRVQVLFEPLSKTNYVPEDLTMLANECKRLILGGTIADASTGEHYDFFKTRTLVSDEVVHYDDETLKVRTNGILTLCFYGKLLGPLESTNPMPTKVSFSFWRGFSNLSNSQTMINFIGNTNVTIEHYLEHDPFPMVTD